MDGSRYEFLSRSRLSENQHRRIGRCDGFQALQNFTQRRAVADHFREIHFCANFIFQVEFFLRELVLQFLYLAIGKCILDGKCNLVCNLGEEIDVRLAEGVVLTATESQKAKDSISTNKWQDAASFESLRDSRLILQA
jgi:hypothetical protein